jgi:hypothetical protein
LPDDVAVVIGFEAKGDDQRVSAVLQLDARHGDAGFGLAGFVFHVREAGRGIAVGVGDLQGGLGDEAVAVLGIKLFLAIELLREVVGCAGGAVAEFVEATVIADDRLSALLAVEMLMRIGSAARAGAAATSASSRDAAVVRRSVLISRGRV